MTRTFLRQTPGGHLHPQIASRCIWPSWTMYANSGQDADTREGTSCTYKVRHKCYLAATNVRLRFCNYSETGNSEQDGPAQNTIKASILHNGTIYPATFGGSSTVLLDPGEQVDSDPIAGLTLPVGDYFHSLTYVQGPADHSWPACYDIKPLTISGHDDGYAAGVDATATGTMTGTGHSGWAYGPSSIFGSPTALRVGEAVAIIGDSIASTVDADSGDLAFLARALDALALPWVRLSTSGDGFGAFVNLEGSRRRLALMADRCSVAVCAYGTNDIRGPENNTLAMVQGWAISCWQAIRADGIDRLYQTTTTPVSEGTSGSQSPVNNTVRSAWNDWLRAGAPMIDGAAVSIGTPSALVAGDAGHPVTAIIEIADVVEPSRNAGTWQSAYFGDGVHPNQDGVLAMAAAVEAFAPLTALNPPRTDHVDLIASRTNNVVSLKSAS